MKPRLPLWWTLILLLGAGVLAHGQEKERDKRSAAAEKAAKLRAGAIRAEISKLGAHDWAGSYYAGDGLGVNTTLLLAPGAGFVFEWHGCLGLYDRNYGAVNWAGDRVRLSFTFPNERKGFQGLAPELVPVPWGSRRYLVPADDLVGFCNSVNSGSEPRKDVHGAYFLRRGDEKQRVDGMPKLPEGYGHLLLAKPLETTILAVLPFTTRPSIVDWKFKDTPVTLDAGSRQGLGVGMELIVVEPRDSTESVRVTRVEEDRAEAVMIQAGEEEPGPKVGWRLSTQAPWNSRPQK